MIEFMYGNDVRSSIAVAIKVSHPTQEEHPTNQERRLVDAVLG